MRWRHSAPVTGNTVISIPEASAQAYDTPKSGTFLQDRQVDVLRITPRAHSTARLLGALDHVSNSWGVFQPLTFGLADR